MSAINWKLRLMNKTTLLTLILSVVSLVYQVLGVCGVIPAISEDVIIQVAGMIVNILCMLGIVVDPTTKGISDSMLALTYDEPSA